MADKKLISIIRQGVSRWNLWRRQNPQARVDLNEADLAGMDLRGALLGRVVLDYANLSGADLSGADLSGADLSGTNLIKARLVNANLADASLEEANLFEADLHAVNFCDASLSGCNLTRARLRAACLPGCDLRGANATRADLRDADLADTHLCETDLSGANLRGADLRRAAFIKTDLSGTSFAFACLGETIFAATSLRNAKSLHLCGHHGPSSIDYLTLASSGALPEKFLRGCGLPDEFVARLPEFRAEAARFPFCFICHAPRDGAFAQRLHDALQALGIRCWRVEPSPISGGQLEDAAGLTGKVLLCCSRSSLESSWLDNEIQQALMREERLGGSSSALLMLDLDGGVHHPALSDWKKKCLLSRPGFGFTGWRAGGSVFKKQVRKLAGQLSF